VNKRTFIKALSAAVASPVFAPLAAWMEKQKLTNWSGNVTYATDRLHEADSVERVRTLVRAEKKLKVLGTRHCFNTIADSHYNLLSLKPMHEVGVIDPDARTVTVEAGITYGQLCPYLDGKGWALDNLASLPHISVAGACSTATHGSGEKNGNLATAVAGLEMVTAAGEVVKLTREADGDVFHGAVVGLGALGAITKVTLKLQPTYQVKQYVYENLPFDQMKEHFDEIQASGYSVSLFTDWQKHNVSELWIKSRVGRTEVAAPAEYFGAKLATKNLHPIADISAENCTEQMGVPGPWYERLPHFKMGFTPSAGKELQSEYFVPRQNALEAILAVERLRDQVTPHLLITEIRTIAADDLWMSTCYRRPSVTIHFTWKPDWQAVRQVLPLIEKELTPFAYRPHWGKLFTTDPAELRKKYERLGDFVELAKKYDPQGKFRNDFLNTNVFGMS
jgi:xylitol oxidase